jgi:hypothetical protein
MSIKRFVRRPHARCNQRSKKIGNAASPEEGSEETMLDTSVSNGTCKSPLF